ncbi:MAG: NAD-dependent epimerase/dehydratase family protein [Proteobacteria bacterium]|nr:NAD-dependent epimerase/dehydratase family protein [Pseudomonadota bacterium]
MQKAPTPPAPSYLLIGAGFTVSRVAALLPKGSCVVTARSPSSCGELKSRFPLVERLDLNDPRTLQELLTRFPSIHTMLDGAPPLEREPEELTKLAKIVGSICANAGVKRFVYISTTGVYGVKDGSWVDQGSPTQPIYRRGKARLAVENGYRQVFGANLSVVRAPAIYGPGRGIGHSLKEKRYRLVDGGTHWTNRIHADDLAAALVQLLTMQQPPQVVCLSDGSPAQACDVADFYCKHFNLPQPGSISFEEALAAGLETMLSNQRINAAASWAALSLAPRYKSYKEGAASEMGVS